MLLKISDILFCLGDNAFLEPYLRRELGDEPKDEPASEAEAEPEEVAPRACVRILQPGQQAEGGELEAEAASRGIQLLTLHCAHIVGTGMTGLPRRMAQRIYQGFYTHPQGESLAMDAVHAVDVARAAALITAPAALARLASLPDGHCLSLTDGCAHTVRDLVEALSFRLGDKRIFTVKKWMARLALGRELMAEVTAEQTLTADARQLTDLFPDFKANDVCHYLRTHNYDDASL